MKINRNEYQHIANYANESTDIIYQALNEKKSIFCMLKASIKKEISRG